MDEALKKVRQEIDLVDMKLIKLLETRVDLAKKAGELKSRRGIDISDPKRENDVVGNAVRYSRLKPSFIEGLFKSIIEYCKNEEHK